MAKVNQDATVAAPKKIGKPKSIEEEHERIEATRSASTVKVAMPGGKFIQVDNVKPVSAAKPKEA